MIVSEDQVRNVLKLQQLLQAGIKQAPQIGETEPKFANLSPDTKRIINVSLSDTSDIIRKERVAAIKTSIAQGKYQPTAIHIASKMVNRSLVDNTLVQFNFNN